MDDFDDRFEPLTESELTAAQAGDDAPKDEGECIMPVPANAPPMPSAHSKLGKPSGRWPYRDADGALLFEVWRFDPDGERKQFSPLSIWSDASGALRWRWKAVPAPRPLYGLDWLAAMPGASVVVCEGEKAADAAALTFPKSVCITSAGGCKAAAKANFEPLAGRRVLIWPDADEPGEKFAGEVARIIHGLGCEVSIIDAAALASLAPDGGQREPVKGWDAADAIGEWQDLAALRKAAHGLAKPYEAGPHEPKGEDELNAAIRLLAAMSDVAYESARVAEAKRLGVRVSVLDKLRAAERPHDEAAPGQGRPLVLPEPDPWPEPVEGAELLSELRDTTKRFLVCSNEKAVAVALWIAATWFEPAAQVAPILNIRSPMPRCGKTTLLDLIERLSKRPLAASSITPAALFRTVETCLPTLIIDEADSFFGDNEELRGIVNSGHTRQAAFVIRTVGEDHEPRRFSTWSFKAISGIGKRAVTIEDRSIAIDLERKLRTEQVSRLRHAPQGLFAALQQKLCRWSSDNLSIIAGARPSLPEALDDRQQDNWEILVAIADLAGGEWPALARNAALSLSNSKDDIAPLGGQLLDDVQEIVNGSSINGVHSRELLDKLVAMPERPWGECNHGKPLTQNRLAKMLGAFGLKTKDLRIGGVVQRGYDLAVLRAAFERYCPVTPVQRPESSFQSATVLPVNEINGLYETQSATIGVEVALQNQPNQLKNNVCSTVALQNPESGDESEIGDFEGPWRVEF